MEFRALGPLTLRAAGREIKVSSARQRTILAMLLLERNHVVAVHRLIDALWPDAPPDTARSQIQICVSALRRVFAETGESHLIRTIAPGYLLQVADGMVDVDEFHRHRKLSQGHAAAGRWEQAIAGFRVCQSLWRGDPFADVDSPLVRSAVTGLTELRQSTAETCIELELMLDHHDTVRPELAALVSQYPLRERLREMYMLALYRSGRRGEALDVYRDTRRTLIEELGIEPGAQLRELERAIISDDPSLAPPRVRLTAAQAAAPPVPRQLPSDLVDFAGRGDLIDRSRPLLLVASDDSRRPDHDQQPGNPAIIAVTGRAGVGKTSLAIRLAHEVIEAYPDGQLFARLHGENARPVAPARILERFLRALGVIGNAVPEETDERGELFRSLVAGRRLLIVLDDAASEGQVIPLLPGMGVCAVLVTSRRRLAALPGARHVEVEVLDEESSIRLLAAHSRRELVGEELASARILVQRCGGLPLAVRIAAARLVSRPHWSVTELAQRLADGTRRLDELRHGELGVRSSIALTYDGLPEPARQLFRLLAVVDLAGFPSWMTAPLLDTDPGEAAEWLELLVEARMVDAAVGDDGTRYRLHDLLRVYARERLVEEEPASQRVQTLRRLFGCLLYLAEQAHKRVYGGDYTVLHSSATRWRLPDRTVTNVLASPQRWLARERATIVEAVGQAAGAGLHEYAWDLVMCAVALFEQGMYFDDWRDTTELALGSARSHGDRRGEAVMRYSLGALAVAQQRPAEAVVHLEAAGKDFDELGLSHGTALVLRNLAFVDRLQGRLTDAIDKYRCSLRTFQSVGDWGAQAHVLIGMSRIHVERHEHDVAQRLLQDALAICRSTGNHRVGAQATHALGEQCLSNGDLDGAKHHFGVVLRTVRQSGDRVGEGYALAGLGAAALRRNEIVEAVDHLTAGLDLAREIGERMIEARILLTLGEMHLIGRRPTVAVGFLTEAVRVFRQLGAALFQAVALKSLGGAHLMTGDATAARRSWTDALGVLGAVGSAAGRAVSVDVRALVEQSESAPAQGTEPPTAPV